MIVRDATGEDAVSVAALLAELGYPNTPEFTAARIGAFSDRPSSHILIAEIDGVVSGFLAFDAQPLFHQSGKIGCIMALCVTESVRGRGVGRALVEQIESIAREMGCVKLSVASGLRRTETHRFYENLGYEEITKRFVKQLC